MESDREQIQAQLREIERGEAASWVTYPPTPAWWPALWSAWTFAYAAGIGLLEGLWQALACLALAVVAGGVAGAQRRVRGTWPTGRPPGSIKKLMTVLFGVLALVAALSWLVGETFGVWPAAVLAAAGVGVAVWRYEQAYAREAARVRERLA